MPANLASCSENDDFHTLDFIHPPGATRRVMLQLKKNFAHSDLVVHICARMNQKYNNQWWWHTNSSGVL